jgi:hypothetical protein
MLPGPGRRVERGGKSVASVNSPDKALLIVENRREPYFAEQRVT